MDGHGELVGAFGDYAKAPKDVTLNHLIKKFLASFFFQWLNSPLAA
jgi:hypothetical protein